MSIGTVIAFHRNLRKMSAKDLGKLIHKTPGCICNWEAGRSRPGENDCKSLCKILKITPNDLYEWGEEEKTDEQLLTNIYRLISRQKKRSRKNKQN